MQRSGGVDSYVDELVAAGRNVIVYDNGDVIMADSPRLPRRRDGDDDAKKSCIVKMCFPGLGSTTDLELDHGSSYHGHERKADGSCVPVVYRCEDGRLV